MYARWFVSTNAKHCEGFRCPPLFGVATGSQGDVGSVIVDAVVKPGVGTDVLAAMPDAPEQSVSTHTPSQPVSHEHQQTVTPGLFHSAGRYQILGEHGRGGLGRVSRAYDRALGRDVAIKELISRGGSGEVRFLREAMITARLEHPSIVPVHEAGRWPDGTPYYAMKLVAGRPLRDLILERTTVGQRIGLLHHVISVADAIAYAHGRNIIHRDLKPANVIVGDFGETIVIDWGLAKDLSATEESARGDGPFHVNQDSDLTATGAILGTPMYMAPEQERGEHVDQRADVFAIGAMLWELCSLHRVPPMNPRLRRRILRHGGIDQDLAVIINKALDPDPNRRYRDAGALAADLKAFKSGARIASRRYSLLAVLGHWTRRHRALAASVFAAAVLAFAGIVFFLGSITTERDRAEASNNRLILEHAELLLHSDPSAAFDLLDTYRGVDHHQWAMLRAEAQGLGLSSVRTRPHTLAVLFAYGLADRTLVTLAADGTITKTMAQGISRVIGHGIPSPFAFDYYAPGHLLAYACGVESICLLDVQTETARPSSSDGSVITPLSLVFSPSGDLLASVSADGNTTVWRVNGDRSAAPLYQSHIPSAKSIIFVDDTTIAVQTTNQLALVHLDAQPPAEPVLIAVSAGNKLTSSKQHHLAAVGTEGGTLVIIDTRSNKIVHQEIVCKGYVNKVLAVPSRAGVAYACQDGDAGIWDLEQNKSTVLANIEGGAANLAAAADGRYLLVGGNNGRLLVSDSQTQMVTSYLGHAARLTALLPSSVEFPYIASGDATGVIRTWQPPQTTVRVAIKITAPVVRAILLPNQGPLIALGAIAAIPWYTRTGISGALEGHDPSHTEIAMSPTQHRFAVYGDDNEIEIWSFEPRSKNYKLKLDHSAMYTAAYTWDGAHLISGSRDGTIIEWSNDSDVYRNLATIHEPVYFMRSVPGSDMLVVIGASRTLWLLTATGLAQLGIETDRITSAVCSYDSRWLAVGTDSGIVRLYNLSTRESATILRAETWIDSMAFSRDNAFLAIATKNEIIQLPMSTDPPRQAGKGHHGMPWQRVELAVKSITFSPDGTWLAVTRDHGELWFYRRRDNHWVYLSVGTVKVRAGRFSDDSAYFSAGDSSGRALLIDMHAKVFD